jgi:hypothetical protein
VLVGHRVDYRQTLPRKSNSAWLAHRLASLHNETDKKVFDSVIVVTDRRVLDQQFQNTIYQFDHKQGVVQKIDEDTRQLVQALASGTPIIITTLQRFPSSPRRWRSCARRIIPASPFPRRTNNSP